MTEYGPPVVDHRFFAEDGVLKSVTVTANQFYRQPSPYTFEIVDVLDHVMTEDELRRWRPPNTPPIDL